MTDQIEMAGTPEDPESGVVEATPVVMKESAGTLVPRAAEVPTLGSPFDVPAEQFRMGLDRRRQNRDAMIEWIRDAILPNEGSDYGIIVVNGRKSRPSLWKAGAEKICGMLNLTPIWPAASLYEQKALNNEPIDWVLLKCELHYGGEQGPVVGMGVGARSVEREKGDLNKTIKMAKKSGMIDAVLSTAGLSEIFTLDLEDMLPEDAAHAHENTDSPPVPYEGPGSNLKEYADGSCEVCGAALIRRKSKSGKPYITCELNHRAFVNDEGAKGELAAFEATNPKLKGKKHTWKWLR